jgi:bifunctional non-homologous end joining protein LigD
VSTFEADADEMLVECERLGLEGLVAKRVDSRYEAGKRSRAWLKLKCEDWRADHAPLRHER